MNKGMQFINRKTLFAGFSLFLISFPLLLKAQLTSEQIQTAQLEKQQESKKVRRITSGLEQKLRRAPASKAFVEKLDFHYAAIEGFDLNPRLKSSSHRGSFYTEQEMSIAYTDRIKKGFIYRLTYDLWHMNYYNTSNRNILEQSFKAETALRLVPKKLFLETEYRYVIFRRQHTPIADYNGSKVKLGLKHYLVKGKLYQKPSWIFRHRGYDKFKVRDAEGNPGSKSRRDNLNVFDYEIGAYLFHHVLIRVHNRFGRNESNDGFKDFFDYSYYSVTPHIAWHVTPKWLFAGGFHYQRNIYDGRDIKGFPPERENLTSFFGGLYYQINKYLIWSVNCNQIKNGSNIPDFEYDDAWFSTGIHVRF